jgi:3-deoxy-7-phosphoheptulonate synthase
MRRIHGTDGDVRTAVNALASSRHPHSFIGTDQAGQTSVLETAGNDSTYIILRGGKDGPNYRGHHIDAACAVLTEAGVEPSLMVDCSHGNSRKNAARRSWSPAARRYSSISATRTGDDAFRSRRLLRAQRPA